MLASLAGSAQAPFQLRAVPPDALAVEFSAGAGTTTFGARSIAPATASSALAVLGIEP